MNIRFKGRRYRLAGRFFMLIYLVTVVVLSATMTLDFEQRMNKPHGRFFIPVSEVSHIGYVKPLGEFTITHYSASLEECGKTDGVTITGTQVTEGRTIAVDPDVIPLGSTVIIDGHEYVAEDIGGAIHGKKIDIYVEDRQEALSRGVITREVYKEN